MSVEDTFNRTSELRRISKQPVQLSGTYLPFVCRLQRLTKQTSAYDTAHLIRMVMVSVQMSSSEISYQCDGGIGCAYGMVETVEVTASTDAPDIPTNLPLSIVPSDVLGSLVGSSIPATLITDTGSIDVPASTQWHSPSTSSVVTSSESVSAISTATTHQSDEDQSTLLITTETSTYPSPSSPTATGVSMISIASTSASASASADSNQQSAASTKHKALGGRNILSVGFDHPIARMCAEDSCQVTYEGHSLGSCIW